MSAYVLVGAAFVGVLLSLEGAMALNHACAQVKTVEQTLSELEDLNRTLRAQRHDFKNHVQVMSALLEMGEADEAKQYVARLSQDLRNVGLALRTSKPAVNALLQAKANICDSRGIRFEMDIATRLDTLPIEQWELCRVLGNLIDNAVEAQEIEKTESPLIRVSMFDRKGAIVLSVFNNGTRVPDSLRSSVFLPDVSTKGTGRGMGLAIVREIAENAGGSAAMESDENGTCLTVTLPYENPGITSITGSSRRNNGCVAHVATSKNSAADPFREARCFAFAARRAGRPGRSPIPAKEREKRGTGRRKKRRNGGRFAALCAAAPECDI